MKIINNRYKQVIDFDFFNNYVLAIENSNEYLKVLQEIFNETNGIENSEFVLSDNGETLKFSKAAIFIYDYLNLDINNRKIINEINAQVLELLKNHDNTEDFFKINQIFIDINDKLLNEFDFKLNYDSELTFEKFIKLSNYHIDLEANLADRIVSYIKIYSCLKDIKLVIFTGLFEIFSKEEVEKIVKQIEYFDLKCLLIEPYIKYDFKSFGRIVVDADLCEI